MFRPLAPGEFLPKGAIVYTASGRKADVSDTGRVQRSFCRSALLPASAVPSFRAFAGEQGVMIPAGDDADKQIERMLLRDVAFAKWGETGLYRMPAVLDRDVTAAVALFGQAQAILAMSAQK